MDVSQVASLPAAYQLALFCLVPFLSTLLAMFVGYKIFFKNATPVSKPRESEKIDREEVDEFKAQSQEAEDEDEDSAAESDSSNKLLEEDAVPEKAESLLSHCPFSMMAKAGRKGETEKRSDGLFIPAGDIKESRSRISDSEEEEMPPLEETPPTFKSKSGEDKDPIEYCSHIPSEVKKIQHRVAQKKVEQKMSPEELESEKDAQKKQLEAIFKLMQDNHQHFGQDQNTGDVDQQVQMYGLGL